MLKEKVAETLRVIGERGYHPLATYITPEKETEQILNFFKAEVDKLTVIDDESISKHWHGWAYDEPRKYVTIHDYLVAISNDQLQHTKKQLLESMEYKMIIGLDYWECHFCGKRVGEEGYCFGCGAWICDECNIGHPVGDHTVEDHRNPKLGERERLSKWN